MRKLEAMDIIWLALLLGCVAVFVWDISGGVAAGDSPLTILLGTWVLPILIINSIMQLVPKASQAIMLSLMILYLLGILTYETLAMPINLNNIMSLNHIIWMQFGMLVFSISMAWVSFLRRPSSVTQS